MVEYWWQPSQAMVQSPSCRELRHTPHLCKCSRCMSWPLPDIKHAVDTSSSYQPLTGHMSRQAPAHGPLDRLCLHHACIASQT